VSLLTNLRRQPNQDATPAEATGGEATGGEATAGEPATDEPGRRGRFGLAVRRAVAVGPWLAPWLGTTLAGLLVLAALVLPNRYSLLTPGAFARIPAEAVLGLVLVLLLRPRAARTVAALGGAVLGVLTLVKVFDLGFYAVLARPFDPVLDWGLFDDGISFVADSVGRAGAAAAVYGAVALALAVILGMALSAVRLTTVAVRHGRAAAACAVVLAVAWVASAGVGAQVVPKLPVADRNTTSLVHARAHQFRAGLADQRAFTREVATDAFRGVPGDRLLTALRGKDVLFAFVESYGRNAVEDDVFAAQVRTVLDDGTRRLAAAGYGSRSAFLTSPTAGGGSWLAHATFTSGVWIDNEQRYRTLMSSDRLTLTGAFGRADWETATVAPGVKRAWPEGTGFYGFDRVHAAEDLGYRGPKFGWATLPDQYALDALQRLELGRTDRGPLMAEIPLVSSHGPWSPVPRFIDWNDIGDGSVYRPMAAGATSKSVVWRDADRVRASYGEAIGYSLTSLISYVERYGDDDLVLVFLGDHQPVPIVTGSRATHDVPITIVTRDPAVLGRAASWRWQDGLRPGPGAPVWRMDSFRDRFLTTFR
jgi:hypothetical protein